MAITDTNVIDGPNVQADGQYRGTVQFIFGDGRVFQQHVMAADINEWTNRLADLPSQWEAKVALDDAQADINEADDIAAYQEATQAQRAAGYLLKAYENEDPYTAYKLMSKFNSYRILQGWTVAQARTVLTAPGNGMTVEQFDNIIAAWQFLDTVPRPTVMLSYDEIRSFWGTRP